MEEPQRREHPYAQTHTDTHRHTRRYWAGAGASNPPQSRAPPRGPAAQGATSDQASRRLQIRSALSPPAGSGDPPPLPSAPAPLRANAPLREGLGLLRSGSQGQSAPASGLHRPPCSRASRDSMRTPEAEDTAGPGAVHCSRRSGLRTQRWTRPLGLSGLSFPSAEAHAAQAGQGPVPAGHGLPTPAGSLRHQRSPIPAINPVSFEQPNAHLPGSSVCDPRATTLYPWPSLPIL